MDALAAEVWRAAEAGVAAGEAPHATFARIRALAHAAAGGDLEPPRPVEPPVRAGPRGRAPHLSESWFC
jgi:hypothetical protein